MRILLADESEIARFALAALLEQQSGWIIAGEILSAKEILPKIKTTNPDLVLLSWNLPNLCIEEMIPTLATKFPDLAIVVLSGRPETRSRAMAAGANAFVSKADPPARLLEAVKSFQKLSQR